MTREIVFREDLNLCVLTERRVFAPYGLAGGDPGRKGKNTLVTKDGRCINLSSKSEVKVKAGVSDSVMLELFIFFCFLLVLIFLGYV